jgi:hypothetical protein
VAPRHGSNSLLQQPWRSSLHALLCPWSVTLIGSSGTTQVVSVASGDLPQLQTPSKCSGPAGTPSAAAFRRRPSNLSSWLSSSAAGGVLRALSPHGKAGQQQGLFKGLRVRVGLATGAIRRGEAVETTMAYSMARGRWGVVLLKIRSACTVGGAASGAVQGMRRCAAQVAALPGRCMWLQWEDCLLCVSVRSRNSTLGMPFTPCADAC